jgi:hypothetical protein
MRKRMRRMKCALGVEAKPDVRLFDSDARAHSRHRQILETRLTAAFGFREKSLRIMVKSMARRIRLRYTSRAFVVPLGHALPDR